MNLSQLINLIDFIVDANKLTGAKLDLQLSLEERLVLRGGLLLVLPVREHDHHVALEDLLAERGNEAGELTSLLIVDPLLLAVDAEENRVEEALLAEGVGYLFEGVNVVLAAEARALDDLHWHAVGYLDLLSEPVADVRRNLFSLNI